jgi:uncharacterized protein YggT (Ycf19 family)
MIGNSLASGLMILITILSILIFIRMLLSFSPEMRRGHTLIDVLDMWIDPVLRPFRRLSMGAGSGVAIDFSPVLAILTLRFAAGIVAGWLMLLPF